MWYEVLPCSAVIGGCLAFANIFTYVTNKLVYNQPFKRIVLEKEDAYMVLRDGRVSNINWAYKFVGLENIPDADSPQTSTK